MTSLKLALIKSLDHLRANDKASKESIQTLNHALKQSAIIIPDTEQSKNEIAYLISMLFTQHPVLMTDHNKNSLDLLQKALETRPYKQAQRKK